MENSEVLTLIRRTLAGDDNAFAALFHQYKNLVFKTAFVMLGNREEANDLLQDVFLEVHRALPGYQASKGAFSTWLYRITVNDCLSWKRKRRFLFISFDALYNKPHTEFCFDSSSSGTHEEQTENADQIFKAMSHLSPKLRAAVALRYYQDLSYAEIATILTIPIGTVKSRLCQAMDVLRKYLERPTADVVVAQSLLTPSEANS